MTYVQTDPVARFWKHVNKTDKCWLWTKKPNALGRYDSYFSNAYPSTMSPHRFSYILHFGKIPKHTRVFHTCGRMNCVNPRHLVAKQINRKRSKAAADMLNEKPARSYISQKPDQSARFFLRAAVLNLFEASHRLLRSLWQRV